MIFLWKNSTTQVWRVKWPKSLPFLFLIELPWCPANTTKSLWFTWTEQKVEFSAFLRQNEFVDFDFTLSPSIHLRLPIESLHHYLLAKLHMKSISAFFVRILHSKCCGKKKTTLKIERSLIETTYLAFLTILDWSNWVFWKDTSEKLVTEKNVTIAALLTKLGSILLPSLMWTADRGVF